MVLVDGKGVPLGVHLSPANLNESQLAEATLNSVAVPRRCGGRPRKKPERIIADKAYDSRKLWKAMRRRGIKLIAPHRKYIRNRYQDGRQLRRYRRRWKVERTNSWLFNFRRLVVRYENRLENFRAFLYLACALITLAKF